ncbi:MAG: glycosyltransferase family 39 protein, partial [Planctomycetaceae bacterium]|nr:glycosyltransferase family 39 protein [Planctomycetaceae bacterium]
MAVIVPVEYHRLCQAIASDTGWAAWFAEFEPDTTLPLFTFLLIPLAWQFQTRRRSSSSHVPSVVDSWFGKRTKPTNQTNSRDLVRAAILASLVGCTSILLSGFIGSTPVEIPGSQKKEIAPLSTLPPALHDEYSYLFQAQTFLAGRIAFDSNRKHPGLFDQMHVLNDNGVYASRYFPGTGLWMAPFVALKRPHWGHWIAGALGAVFVFFIGRELAGNLVGFVAGLLTAVSPGVQLFGQLLLAHHPTLMGLTFFAWMFLRMMRTKSFLTAGLAGLGLAFGMICRPMTAAGI